MHINAPYELVLFGGLGDLALRKLMPALYLLYRDGRLPSGRIFAATRQTLEREDFLGRIEKALKSHLPSEYLELATWEGFSQCLHCLTIDLNSAQGYLDLATTLGSDDPKDRKSVV